MAESVFFKPVSLAFAIVTLIESLIWTILAFLPIVCYNDIIDYDNSTNYGLNIFVKNLYSLYLSAEWHGDGRIVTQDVFYTLMWLYFFVSLFLFFASGVHIAVLTQISSTRKINLSTIIWQILTYTVCIYDIITCILFAHDYHLVRQAEKEDSAESEVMVAVIITLIVLSAKGFVLWIVNFVFSVIITVLFTKKVKVNDEPILSVGPLVHARNYSAYNAYGNMNIDDKDLEDNNNNITNGRPNEEESYPSMNNSTWFTKPSEEVSHRSYTSLTERAFSPSIDPLDEILRTNSTWSHMPRASSFRQPRSLAASLSPSPVPPPSKATPRSGRKSAPPDIWNRDRGYDAYSSGYRTDDEDKIDYNDDDDDISESMNKMKRVFPIKGRFNLDEPDNDYDDDDVSESMSKMSRVFPIKGRFNSNEPGESNDNDDDDDDVSESMSKMSRVYPNHRRFNLDEPDPDYETKF